VAPLDLARSVAARPVPGLRAAPAGNLAVGQGGRFFYRKKKDNGGIEPWVMRAGVGVGWRMRGRRGGGVV
jgi:hypothetical protein